MDFRRKIEEIKGCGIKSIHPAGILATHVTFKGMQIGSMAGLILGIPTMVYLKKVSIAKAWLKVMST